METKLTENNDYKDGLELAHLCAKIASDKIAEDILILDLREIEASPSDFFVLCSCDTDIQVRAIVDQISRETKAYIDKRSKIEGIDLAQWVIMDFFDVVVHVMQKPARTFYKIEKLWADAEIYSIENDDSLNKIEALNLNDIYAKGNEE